MRAHHLALLARDVDRLAAFYNEVLQLPLLPAPRAGVAWLSLGETILMIEPLPFAAAPQPQNVEAARSGFHLLALRIEPSARAAWEQRLRERCVVIEQRSDFTLYIRDPEGNRVGLSHYPER